MESLNFPRYQFRLKRSTDDSPLIFDETRKKWLHLTPEEWVRQHWIKFLEQEIKVPKGFISSETGLKINNLNKRTDLLVYKNNSVFLIIECKRPTVPITEKTLNQIIMYNKKYLAQYLVLSNGTNHKYFKINYEEKKIIEVLSLPNYQNW